MEKEVIECERKWILWEKPHHSLQPHSIIELEYLFSPEGVRYQKEIRDGKPPAYLIVDKRPTYEESGKRIGSSREERIETFHEGQFQNLMIRPDHAYLSKVRHVHLFGDLKAEIDLYHQHQVITMEVEKQFSKEDEYWRHKAHIFESQKIQFPEKIEAVILTEVTGKEEVSNFNLAQLSHRASKFI